MSKTGMMAAVAAAAGLSGEDSVVPTAALLAEHFPAVAAELKAEGAKAERERLAAMDAAAVPGHEALVTAHKADGSKTAGDLALAILGAEKAQRASVMTGLAADEAKLKGLRSEPANGSEPPPNAKAGLKGEDLWKAEFAESADLAAEFPSVGAYIGFKKLEADGRLRTTSKSKTA